MSQISTELGNYILTETGLELVTEDHIDVANTRFIVGLIQYRPAWAASAQVFAAMNAQSEAEVTMTADFEAQV